MNFAQIANVVFLPHEAVFIHFEFTLLQLKFSTHPSSALILATPIAEILGYIKYILMWIFIRFKVTK